MSGPTATPPAASRAAPPGKIKGTLLMARLRYLRAQGPEAEGRVVRRLSSSDQAVVGGVVLPSTWYPAPRRLRLESTIAAVLERGDRVRLFLDMGRFSADANLGPAGVQRPFLREGDPQALLQNVPRMYVAQHTDGERTFERLGPTTAVIRTTGGGEVTAEDCLTAVGWLERAIQLCGGAGVRVVETSCRARGGAACEYRCEWR